jgi:hypothetical protein
VFFLLCYTCGYIYSFLFLSHCFSSRIHLFYHSHCRCLISFRSKISRKIFSLMFENTSCLSISLHLSLIVLHVLIALISAWICQIYDKHFISNSTFVFFAQTSALGYLSAIHHTFLLFPKSPCAINVANISQTCSELVPSYYPSLIPVQPRCLLRISHS